MFYLHLLKTVRMGIVQKDAFRTMIISYFGIILGYLNKGVLFVLFLKTEQIGLINLLVSVGILFAQFANLGTVYSIWKFFPFFKNHEKKHHGFLPYILIIVFIGVVTCTVSTLIFREQIENLYREKSLLFVDYFLWIFPIGISYIFFLIFEMYLRSLYKNIISVFLNEVVLRLILTGLLFLYWLKIISFSNLVIFHAVSYILPVILMGLYMFKIKELNLLPRSINIPKKFKKMIISYSLFNYINTLGSIVVISIDVIMIAQILGLKGTGVYSTVVFITSVMQVPYRSVIRTTTPMIAEYWKSRDMKAMKELYQKVSSVLLVITGAGFIWLWLNIDFLFSFLGHDFVSGIPVFLFLMIGKLIDMYFGLNGAILVTSKKFKYDIFFTVFLIFVVISLNFILIPVYGISGAAISTSVGLLMYNFSRLFFVWYHYKIHPFDWRQVKIIVLGALTLFVGYYLRNLNMEGWNGLMMQTAVFLVGFIIPIYILKLNQDIIDYFHKGTAFLKQKIYKK